MIKNLHRLWFAAWTVLFGATACLIGVPAWGQYGSAGAPYTQTANMDNCTSSSVSLNTMAINQFYLYSASGVSVLYAAGINPAGANTITLQTAPPANASIQAAYLEVVEWWNGYACSNSPVSFGGGITGSGVEVGQGNFENKWDDPRLGEDQLSGENAFFCNVRYDVTSLVSPGVSGYSTNALSSGVLAGLVIVYTVPSPDTSGAVALGDGLFVWDAGPEGLDWGVTPWYSTLDWSCQHNSPGVNQFSRWGGVSVPDVPVSFTDEFFGSDDPGTGQPANQIEGAGTIFQDSSTTYDTFLDTYNNVALSNTQGKITWALGNPLSSQKAYYWVNLLAASLNSTYVTPTSTPTSTPPNTPTLTATQSPSPSPTNSYTSTNTYTLTDTSSPTSSFTLTFSTTPTSTPTLSFTPTPSFTFTFSPTSTGTSTATDSATDSPTDTDSFTSTPTFTPTLTATNSSTSTPTQTETQTETWTPTTSPTQTYTPTDSFTSTATATPSFTATLTFTNSFTSTPTVTYSFTPSFTATMTCTSTPSNSPTWSPTLTDSSTPTLSPTWTPTPSETSTPTLTFTFTVSYTPTATFSVTPTPSVTSTPTSTDSFTPTSSPTQTGTPTSTSIAKPYKLLVEIYNSAGELVAQILSQAVSLPVTQLSLNPGSTITSLGGAQGTVSIYGNGSYLSEWNGTNSSGTPVSNGIYYLKVESLDNLGNEQTLVAPISVSRPLQNITVEICNESGELVRSLYSAQGSYGPVTAALLSTPQLNIGPTGQGSVTLGLSTGVTLSWNGMANNGEMVSNGSYFLEVFSSEEKGEEMVFTKVLSVVNNERGLQGLTAYPNYWRPGSPPISIKTASLVPLTLRARIYDLAGQWVNKAEGPVGANQIILDTQTLASGVYIVLVEEWNNNMELVSRQNVKILIEH